MKRPDPRLLVDAVHLASRIVNEVPRSIESGSVPRTRGEFTQWTLAVKTWLAKEAELLGFRALSNHAGGREFLLDMVWWQQEDGERAVLACESEFGNSRYPDLAPMLVGEDFDKLLSFKSPLKIMIFDSYTDGIETQRKVIEELNKYLQNFGDHRKGETYIAIDLCKRHKAWTCSVAIDGQDRSLQLQKLGTCSTLRSKSAGTPSIALCPLENPTPGTQFESCGPERK